MKNYILTFGCLFVAFTITPSFSLTSCPEQKIAPKSKNLVKTNNFYELVCNQTIQHDYESQVNWWGVAGALLPILALIPEEISLVTVALYIAQVSGTLSQISVSSKP